MQRDARLPKRRFLAVAACALVPCLVLPACSSTPDSRFYVLTSATDSVADEPSMTVGIEPVILPASVDRPQMVMHVSDNERSLWEFDRWAGPLAENMAQVLVLNLEAHLGATSAYTLPSRHAPQVDYKVTVELLLLDAFPDEGAVQMIARFHVADGEGTWITSRRVEMKADQGKGKQEGAQGVVGAMSTGLRLISDSIAGTLQSLPAPTPSDG